jgi:hypothetical protein
MDQKDSFFYRQRLPLYLLIVAFALIALGAMARSGVGLLPFAWLFPAGLLLSFTTLIRPDGALLFGYTVYLGLLIVLFRAQTVARAQTILVLLLIVVIATVNGCRKTLGDLT